MRLAFSPWSKIPEAFAWGKREERIWLYDWRYWHAYYHVRLSAWLQTHWIYKYTKAQNSLCVMRCYWTNEQKLLKCDIVTIDENDKILERADKSLHSWRVNTYLLSTFMQKEDINPIWTCIYAGFSVDTPWKCDSANRRVFMRCKCRVGIII